MSLTGSMQLPLHAITNTALACLYCGDRKEVEGIKKKETRLDGSIEWVVYAQRLLPKAEEIRGITASKCCLKWNWDHKQLKSTDLWVVTLLSLEKAQRLGYATYSSETCEFLRTTRRYNVENCTPHNHRCENIKSNKNLITRIVMTPGWVRCRVPVQGYVPRVMPLPES
jgi:hypothetical protein